MTPLPDVNAQKCLYQSKIQKQIQNKLRLYFVKKLKPRDLYLLPK